MTLGGGDVPKIAREIFDVQNESETLGRVLRVPKVTVDSIIKQYI